MTECKTLEDNFKTVTITEVPHSEPAFGSYRDSVEDTTGLRWVAHCEIAAISSISTSERCVSCREVSAACDREDVR